MNACRANLRSGRLRDVVVGLYGRRLQLARSYAAEQMRIVQFGSEREDLKANSMYV
jgi:hypothetical protein